MLRKISLPWWFGVIFGIGAILAFVPRIYEAAPHGFSAVALRIAEGLGEALIIAAILGTVVDRYAKLKLATEVGETIAEKIHGYHLPDPLKAAINKVNNFSFVWSDVLWDIDMFATGSADGCLLWKSTLSYNVVNISSVEQEFTHTAAIRSARSSNSHSGCAQIAQVVHAVDGIESYRYTPSDKEFRDGLTVTDMGMSWASKDSIRIPPWDRHDPKPKTFRFFNSIEKVVEENELRSILFRYPVINGVRINVEPPPDGFEVTSSLESDNIERKHPPGRDREWEWHSTSVFLNNQRIAVRHHRTVENPIHCPEGTNVQPNSELTKPLSEVASAARP